MAINYMSRAINNLEETRKRARIELQNGQTLIGTADCISWVPSDENERDEEMLKFDLEDGSSVFIREEDIKSYSYL